MKLYMAGALFSQAERSFNRDLAAALRRYGHEVFLPQEHEQRADRPDLIFKSDVAGIDWCEMVLACLDGPDPDSGTCWEIGYGYGTKKLLLNYRTDFRVWDGADKINLMMTESASDTIYLPWAGVEELAAEIVNRIIAIEKDVGRIVQHWVDNS